MSDEFFLYKAPSLMSLLEELDKAFIQERARDEAAERTAGIVRHLWFASSTSKRQNKSHYARRYGNKTPGAEHNIAYYDSLFSRNPPLYIYTLRDGRAVFESRKNMNWGAVPRIQSQLKRYLDSVATMEAFVAKHPHRLHLVQLDQTADDAPSRARLATDLFEFVGEPMTSEVWSFVNQWKPQQTGSRARRGSPKVLLDDDELAYLDSNQPYQEVRERYGYAGHRHPFGRTPAGRSPDVETAMPRGAKGVGS